jgi:hypothetical protein
MIFASYGAAPVISETRVPIVDGNGYPATEASAKALGWTGYITWAQQSQMDQMMYLPKRGSGQFRDPTTGVSITLSAQLPQGTATPVYVPAGAQRTDAWAEANGWTFRQQIDSAVSEYTKTEWLNGASRTRLLQVLATKPPPDPKTEDEAINRGWRRTALSADATSITYQNPTSGVTVTLAHTPTAQELADVATARAVEQQRLMAAAAAAEAAAAAPAGGNPKDGAGAEAAGWVRAANPIDPNESIPQRYIYTYPPTGRTLALLWAPPNYDPNPRFPWPTTAAEALAYQWMWDGTLTRAQAENAKLVARNAPINAAYPTYDVYVNAWDMAERVAFPHLRGEIAVTPTTPEEALSLGYIEISRDDNGGHVYMAPDGTGKQITSVRPLPTTYEEAVADGWHEQWSSTVTHEAQFTYGSRTVTVPYYPPGSAPPEAPPAPGDPGLAVPPPTPPKKYVKPSPPAAGVNPMILLGGAAVLALLLRRRS